MTSSVIYRRNDSVVFCVIGTLRLIVSVPPNIALPARMRLAVQLAAQVCVLQALRHVQVGLPLGKIGNAL